jgi:hypothetical protein
MYKYIEGIITYHHFNMNISLILKNIISESEKLASVC